MGKRLEDIHNIIKGFNSFDDLFELDEYFNSTIDEKLELLEMCAIHLEIAIQDEDKREDELKVGRIERIRLLSLQTFNEIENELLEIIDYEAKISHLEEFIASIKHSESMIALEYGSLLRYSGELTYYKDLLNVLESKLELLKKEHNQIKGSQDDENIETLNSISSKLVLLKELGVYDLLISRINENTKSKTDLEKLIAYIIGHDNPGSVGRYFPHMGIDSKPETKRTPYTKAAIKEMERIMRDCNIKILGDYSKFTKNE
jgi:hypothetical protein